MTASAVAAAVPRAQRRGRLWLSGWAALVQLVLDVALAVPYLLLVVGLVVGLGLVPVFGVGLVPVALALLAARGLAVLERARVLAFVEDYVPPPLPPRPDQPWWRWLLLDTRPWKAVVHVIAMAVWGLTGALAVLVVLSSGMALALVPTYQRALPGGRLDLFGVALRAGRLVVGRGRAAHRPGSAVRGDRVRAGRRRPGPRAPRPAPDAAGAGAPAAGRDLDPHARRHGRLRRGGAPPHRARSSRRTAAAARRDRHGSSGSLASGSATTRPGPGSCSTTRTPPRRRPSPRCGTSPRHPPSGADRSRPRRGPVCPRRDRPGPRAGAVDLPGDRRRHSSRSRTSASPRRSPTSPSTPALGTRGWTFTGTTAAHRPGGGRRRGRCRR
jgi:hypothetical protein